MFWVPVGTFMLTSLAIAGTPHLTIPAMLAECKCDDCLHFASALVAVSVND